MGWAGKNSLSVGWVLLSTQPCLKDHVQHGLGFSRRLRSRDLASSCPTTLPITSSEVSRCSRALLPEKDMLPPAVTSTTLCFPGHVTCLLLPPGSLAWVSPPCRWEGASFSQPRPLPLILRHFTGLLIPVFCDCSSEPKVLGEQEPESQASSALYHPGSRTSGLLPKAEILLPSYGARKRWNRGRQGHLVT